MTDGRPVSASPPAVAGLLLTGGLSRRLGRPKAELWAPRTATLLAARCSPCLEIGIGASGLTAVPDELPGEGPLAAVATGAGALATHGFAGPAVVLATDMPGLVPQIVDLLVDWPGSGTVVPIVQDQPQLLCARWSAVALEVSRALAHDGIRAMRALLGADPVDYIDEARWKALVPAAAWRDIDTPADLAAWEGRSSDPDAQRARS